MKLNLKTIAIAAAIASMAGAAHADIVSDFTNDGTLVVQAFNTSTRAYYIRDLGYTINSFLPASKTPAGGLTLDSVSNPGNFADSAGWTSWITGQNLSNIRWNVSAVDSASVNKRIIASSVSSLGSVANGQVQNFASSSYAGSVEGYAAAATQGTGPVSFFNTTGADGNLDINWGLGSTGLAALGGTANLYYFTQTGPSGNASGGAYSNGNLAVVSLDSSGNFSYTLAAAPVSAVPLPAAAWLMGAGLLSLGGAVRRRKAAAKA